MKTKKLTLVNETNVKILIAFSSNFFISVPRRLCIVLAEGKSLKRSNMMLEMLDTFMETRAPTSLDASTEKLDGPTSQSFSN